MALPIHTQKRIPIRLYTKPTKAIRAIPSKCRHKYFSLHIFSCLPKQWFNKLSDIIQVSLSTCMQPEPSHIISHVPIPKPDTNKERRPITTREDLACLLSAIVGAALSAGLEKIKQIPPICQSILQRNVVWRTRPSATSYDRG